jgi:antirestriction protein ArdC
MQNTIYQSVTDKIIEQLENGCTPWVKPWNSTVAADKNIATGNEYQGINTLILGMAGSAAGYDCYTWGSFKQWQALGANVRKGEKGTPIVFYSPVSGSKINEQGESETTYNCVLKTYYVFNAKQVEGIEITTPVQEDKPFIVLPELEQAIIKTGANIKHGGNSAFYHRTGDYINVPDKSSFDNESSYYATLLHELTHWSGAPNRLDREKGKRFGDTRYAFEELVAEMGAAFLCASYSVPGELQHSAYIQNWLQCLKDDNKAVFKAAALAQKAADYIKQLDATAQAAA